MGWKTKSVRVWLASTKEILTNEDWHPTIDGKVQVKLYGYLSGMWRVHVRGGDDDEMELDIRDERRARHVFDRIVHLTTKADLHELGLR